MPTSFPGAIDATARPAPETLRDAPGLSLSSRIDSIADGVEAAQAKLGTGGTGTAAPPATPAVLLRTGTGQSGWATLTDAEVAAAAAIAVSKLAAGGTANRVVGTTLGAAMTMQPVASLLVANSINGDRLVTGTVASTQLAPNAATKTFVQVGVTATYGISGATSTQIPEMAYNVIADGATPYLTVFNGSFTCDTAGGNIIFDLMVAGVLVIRRQIHQPVANQQFTFTLAHLHTPTPGTQPIAMNFWMNGAGTVSVLSSQRTLMSVQYNR
jgi:hypothetical protein